ncbi:hypothetical protein [Kitasatospora acidiphila]|uniref:hypothetical protein n=1 Tax=Kitasatospora acidiphila TaxID=2567942 RepID=UPI0015F03DA2|nr:hypothetical protein [Kitasatospora acidiphila]
MKERPTTRQFVEAIQKVAAGWGVDDPRWAALQTMQDYAGLMTPEEYQDSSDSDDE